MAAITVVNIGLQSRDWETLIGIIFPCSDPELQNIFFELQNFYSAQTTKPAGNTVITVASTEDVVLKIATYLYGTNLAYSTQDIGGNCFQRVMNALRLLNNTADNYIQTSFATFDAGVLTTQQKLRKSGRKYIMILTYDNA